MLQFDQNFMSIGLEKSSEKTLRTNGIYQIEHSLDFWFPILGLAWPPFSPGVSKVQNFSLCKINHFKIHLKMTHFVCSIFVWNSCVKHYFEFYTRASFMIHCTEL